jgi:hypothetical protein
MNADADAVDISLEFTPPSQNSRARATIKTLNEKKKARKKSAFFPRLVDHSHFGT